MSSNTEKHHIIPISRGGRKNLENTVEVLTKEHRLYHQLFSNKKPREIIQYLVEEFWDYNWRYVRDSYKRYRKLEFDRS